MLDKLAASLSVGQGLLRSETGFVPDTHGNGFWTPMQTLQAEQVQFNMFNVEYLLVKASASLVIRQARVKPGKQSNQGPKH